MKKVAIFGMVVLMLAFGAGLALANPQADNNSGDANALNGTTTDGSASSSSVTTGIGDVANSSTQTINETKTFDNSKSLAVDSNSLTVTKNDTDTKNITKTDTDTKTITKTDTDSLAVNVGPIAVDSDNKAKNGSAAAVNGNATTTKDSNNTKDVTAFSGNTLGSNNTKNITADNGNSTTVNKTATNSFKKNYAKDIYGSAVAQDGSTATNTNISTKTTTVTIDKSGQNNSKNIIKDISGGSAAAINGNALVDKSKTWNIVDNQVMLATNSGNANSGNLATGTITQGVTKTFSASNSGTFTNINGVINNNNMAGNCNNASALTTISVGGNVNP